MLQPKLGKVLVLDSVDWDKSRYKEFISLNMLAKSFILHVNHAKSSKQTTYIN
jgi:hypothetical protein